ncbi:MAG: hypothetical protein ABI895_33545 [Deltaproteobacteria bacterium]
MANRHSHKKLRAEVRARMARTGESYQQARQRLLARQPSLTAQPVSGFDLLEFSYFGKPAVLASWHSYGVPVAIVLSEAVRRPLMLPRFAIETAPCPWAEGGK